MESTKQIFKRNRCSLCNKKYGLIPFNCRCGGKFCSEHRYSFMHFCNFDHTSFERNKINLQKIIKDKIENRI